MKSSDQLNELATALAKAQAEFKHPKKNKTAKVGTYSYKYSDLADLIDATRPTLAKHGLSVVQGVGGQGKTVAITTRLLHSSGQWLEDTLSMDAADARPQSLGSAITYGRRYGEAAILNITSEDDDDGAAAHNGQAEGYDPKNKIMRASLEKMLTNRGVPGAFWDSIHESMRGLSSADLDRVVAEETHQ